MTFCGALSGGLLMVLTVSGNHFLTVHQRTLIGTGIEVRKAIQLKKPCINGTHLVQGAVLKEEQKQQQQYATDKVGD